MGQPPIDAPCSPTPRKFSEKVAKEEGTGARAGSASSATSSSTERSVRRGAGLSAHWRSGLINGGVGLAVGELNLFTQPTRLKGLLENAKDAARPHVVLVPLIGKVNGAAVAVAF